MKSLITRILKPGTFGRWVATGFYQNPILFFVALMRSVFATKKLTGSFYPVRVRIAVGQVLRVNASCRSRTILVGNLIVNSWGGSSIPSSISCSDNSIFILSGDFEIGPNVHIDLAPGAIFTLGGKRKSSGSGITCNSRIMVEKSLSIGCDCIIAWDVFITDSDHHHISGVTRCKPVSIGEHVWISHGVSILKGAVIPAGCIVGAKSLVSSVIETEKSLLVGVPAKVTRDGVEWLR